MKYRRDLFYLFLLLGLGIIFWGEALAPGQVFFLRDISAEIIPKRHFWATSGGLALWIPQIFFGVPYAANPQSEAFYPFNFLFLIFGAERGLVYYIVFHHLFFLLTFYLSLRRIGFKEEASLIGSVGFGFGGYLISLTLLVVLLSTVAWLGLVIICLSEAAGKKWLSWSLLLSLVMAVQILGGEIEIAVMSWVLAFGAVAFAPGRRGGARDLAKILGVMILGLMGGIILSLPQIAISLELVPISNRAGGMGWTKALRWSWQLSELKSLFISNYRLPASAGLYWRSGIFSGFTYFSSFYLGMTLFLLAVFSLAGSTLRKAYFWLLLALFGLLMMLGDNSGVYKLFYEYLPGFNLFRIPEKFFLFLNFGFILMAAYGYESFSGRKWFLPWAALVCLLAAVAIMVLLFSYPLKAEELGKNYSAVAGYLFWRSILRSSVFFLIMLGLVFFQGQINRSLLGLAFTILVFLDLFFAHHRLNPTTTGDLYKPNAMVREFISKQKDQIPSPRVFPVSSASQNSVLHPVNVLEAIHRDRLDSFEEYSAVYYGINNLRGVGSLYPADADKFKELLTEADWSKNELILARAGAEYYYDRDRGFRKISGAFPRAMIFYQAQMFSDRDQIIKLWARPDFPAEQTLLLEASPGKMNLHPERKGSESAKIITYENEKVVVETQAREDAWLLILDSYYPGWRAEVDGQPVEIYRGDGFFRAVKIPAGRHQVVYSYFPAIFKNSLWVSGIGFMIWLGLMVISIIRPMSLAKGKSV